MKGFIQVGKYTPLYIRISRIISIEDLGSCRQIRYGDGCSTQTDMTIEEIKKEINTNEQGNFNR